MVEKIAENSEESSKIKNLEKTDSKFAEFYTKQAMQSLIALLEKKLEQTEHLIKIRDDEITLLNKKINDLKNSRTYRAGLILKRPIHLALKIKNKIKI